MPPRSRIYVAALVIASAIATFAQNPGQFGNNIYEFVQVADPFTDGNNSWFTAETAAENMAFNGVNGHLATVTSQAENDFLLTLLPVEPLSGFNGAWLGGKFPEGWLVGPEAGSTFTYSNWNPPEPNNDGYLYMSIGTGGYPMGKWVDDSGVQGFPDPTNDPVVGYFVEFENAAVPEPNGVISVALGALVIGIGFVRRVRSFRRAHS